jgi:hypothetical protein
MSVVDIAANMTKAHVGTLTRNRDMTCQAVEATADDMRRSMRLPDASRPVNPERARSAAKKVPGVRSVVWLDRSNLFAIVATNEQRSQATADDICMELEPLGDSLGVVVNLQSGDAINGDELEILARNRQLRPGEQALLQRPRKGDVIDPGIRRFHTANHAYWRHPTPAASERAAQNVQAARTAEPRYGDATGPPLRVTVITRIISPNSWIAEAADGKHRHTLRSRALPPLLL